MGVETVVPDYSKRYMILVKRCSLVVFAIFISNSLHITHVVDNIGPDGC